MRATFGLVASQEATNLVRKHSWAMHSRFGTGTYHCRLPPHISLKLPFAVADLAAVETYMAEFARSAEPFEVTLTEFQVVPILFDGRESGILWIDVEETATLRHLHERLNTELEQRFGNTQAAFDGDEYHFHMTVMIGGQSMNAYRSYLLEPSDPAVNMSFTVRELAMFVYDEPMGPQGEYLCYKLLPIGDT